MDRPIVVFDEDVPIVAVLVWALGASVPFARGTCVRRVLHDHGILAHQFAPLLGLMR